MMKDEETSNSQSTEPATSMEESNGNGCAGATMNGSGGSDEYSENSKYNPLRKKGNKDLDLIRLSLSLIHISEPTRPY